MQKVKLKIMKLAHFKGDLPGYQSALASGFDVRAQLDAPLTLKPGQKAMVPTISLNPGYNPSSATQWFSCEKWHSFQVHQSPPVIILTTVAK